MRVSKNKVSNDKIDIIFRDRQFKKIDPDSNQEDKRRGYRELVLELFSKSPEVGRLLVRLHDRNKLYGLAKNPDEHARAELAQIIVDLLSFDLEPTESELISDVLLSLMRQAERDLRRSLSERLAVMEGVPLRVVLKMASDEIFVADPVLRKSKDLTDFDLIYILKSKQEDHWRSIAMRPQIASRVIDMLSDTKDLQTAYNLVENRSVLLTNYSVANFCDMAKMSEKLAKPLLLREELNSSLVAELYKFVGEELKTYINNNFNLKGLLDDMVDDVVLEFVSSDVDSDTNKKTKADFEMMMEKGLLTPAVMLEHLRLGKIKNFAIQFSVYCGLPLETVRDMLKQEAGHGLAVACKACNISKNNFTNMYLLTSRVRGSRYVAENKLSRALRYYDKVTEDMARDLLKPHRH